ncbi:MAG: thermonuclease family protein, partial [Nitrospirae bacterium]|nr:thermonuclease family protein [Nitrospirota bacterium]
AFGKRAKQAALERVFGKEVTLQSFRKDTYGRTIADMLLADGPTSITHSSKTAGAGGIGSMRQGEIPHLNA